MLRCATLCCAALCCDCWVQGGQEVRVGDAVELEKAFRGDDCTRLARVEAL